MIEMAACSVVVLTGIYLIVLGVMALFVPSRAAAFLLGFAGSAATHYAELLLRLLAGAAFVAHAPRMLAPGVFTAFGWVLLVTTAGLLLIPWQWHHRFASRSVPQAIRHLGLISAASLALGGFILVAVLLGATG